MLSRQDRTEYFYMLNSKLGEVGEACLLLGYFYGLIIEFYFMIWVRSDPPVSFQAQGWAKKDIPWNSHNGILWKWGSLIKFSWLHYCTPIHLSCPVSGLHWKLFHLLFTPTLCLCVFVLQTPEWLDSDSCQKCDQPFFWNFKQMWDSKKIGLRQVCMGPLVCWHCTIWHFLS